MDAMSSPSNGALRLVRGTRWEEDEGGANRRLCFAVNGSAGAVVLDMPIELAGPIEGGRYGAAFAAGPLRFWSYVPLAGASAAPTDLLFGGKGFVTTLDNGDLGESARLIRLLHSHGVNALHDELEARWRNEFVPAETPKQVLARERELGAQMAEARAEGAPQPGPEGHSMQPLTRPLFALTCTCGWATREHDTQEGALAEAEEHVRSLHPTGVPG